MLSETFEIRPFSEELCSLTELVTMHIQISSGTKVSGCLIYKDPNFRHFLKDFVLKSSDENIYLLLNKKKVIGFCRLRFLNDTLHLNNIYINEVFQGKGLGKYLLNGSVIKSLLLRQVKTFSLDVFVCNTAAYNWYAKIGMKVTNAKYWYRIIPETVFSPLIREGINYELDNHGFIKVISGNQKIGSKLNGSLLLNDPESIKYFSSEGLSKAYIKSTIILVNQYNCRLEKLEVSHTMACGIKLLLNSIK